MGGIDQHDHLAEALALHQRQQILLVLGQLQVAPAVVSIAVARRVHIHGQVAALTADTGEHNHRHVGVCLGALEQGVAVLGRGHLGGGEVGAGEAGLVGPLHAGVLVEIHQLLVDLQPGVGEALDQVHVGGLIAGPAARAAIQGGDRGVAKEVDLGPALQRQGAVLVLQQDNALGGQLLGHSQGGLFCLLRGELFGGGGAVGSGQAAVQVGRHEGVDGGEHLNAHHIDHQRQYQQDTDHDQRRFPCCLRLLFLAHFHLSSCCHFALDLCVLCGVL